MGRKLLIIFLAVAALLAAALYLGTGGVTRDSGKLNVVASFYVPAEFARLVGGNKVDVETIAPPGIEPHDFEPTAKQVRLVFRAKVFLFNGAGFDPWAEKIERETAAAGIVTRNLSGYFRLSKESEKSGEDGRGQSENGGLDPHVWLDPVLAKKEVRIIRDALIKADPVNAAYFRKNAAEFEDELTALDKSYREGLRNCAKRKAISSHAAFGYLAKRYNIDVIPVSVSPNEEPSARRIGEVSTLVKREKIDYIFFETLVSPEIAETISRETGAKALVFNPIEGLTAGEARQGEDYISLMKRNLKTLRTALGCQ